MMNLKDDSHKKAYRNEWKYFCSTFRLDAIENRLKASMQKDEHLGSNLRYIVHSLYFDDCSNMCLNDVEAGNPERFKYRIRYYNNDLSTLKIERKEKSYGYCRKYSTQLSVDEAKEIIEGDYFNLFWKTQNNMLKRFLLDLIKGNFRPKIITKYERCALEDKIKNVRVTLDRNIKSSVDFYDFLSGNYTAFSMSEGNRCVIEIKFDYILPDYIKRLCYSNFMSRQTFSKYYLARKNMKRMNQWNF